MYIDDFLIGLQEELCMYEAKVEEYRSNWRYAIDDDSAEFWYNELAIAEETANDLRTTINTIKERLG